MNLEFGSLNIEERPTLVLETLSFSPIAVMGDAYGLSSNIAYNETSEIQFKVPHFVDGIENTYYDDISTMRIVHVTGLGRFLMTDPQDTIDGIREIKECKGYSLEYELSYKTLNLASGTYNLWNPLKPDGTILGMFMKDFPHWKVNHMVDGVITINIDASLIDKYRTFETSETWLSFLKGTAQQAYQCIFEFDPFERIISVRAAKAGASQLPVYIAPENIAKEIQISEQSDDIFTVFDVYGAADVDIRSVNPTGTNKIYNLDYYMTEKNFSSELIAKYHEWHEKIRNVRDSYYSYTIQRANAYVELELAKAEYTKLQSEYTSTENLYSVAAQAELSGTTVTKPSSEYRTEMNEIHIKMLVKEAEINSIQTRIDSLQAVLDEASNGLAFEQYFADELVELSPYLKESVMTESSFVAMNTKTYGETGALLDGTQFDILISDASVVDCTNAGSDNGVLATDSKIATYRADGGTVIIESLVLKDDGTTTTTRIVGDVQHAIYNINTEENKLVGSIVFQKEVTHDDGSTDTVTATVTVVRNDFTVSMLDVETTYDYESENLEISYTGHMNLKSLTKATVFMTSETTEFQRSNVQWELYDYAWELLNKVAYPSYSFAVDSGNFLTLDDFVMFKNWFKLGERVYLQLREGYVISPIVVRAEFEYDDPESLKLEFANQFNSNAGEFNLVDLLEQSISTGGTVDTSKLGWNAWEDSASTVVGDFMKAEIDVFLNKIKASTDQSIEIDGSGIHLRKLKSVLFNNDATDADGNPLYDDITKNSEFDPCQIWMSNDAILFTDDGWQSCKMAIGKGSLGYGIIADYLVGTFMASENLTITNKAGNVFINNDGMTVDGMSFKIKHSKDDPGKSIMDVLDSSSSFAQTTVPENPGEGDLWYVSGESDITTDDGTVYSHGKWYRFDGTAWVELTDADLSAITTTSPDGDAKVALGSVYGFINTTVTGMSNTVGNLFMDESGLWLMDTIDPKTATKAIWLNGSGILISSSRTATNSDCPSYNENTGKSFSWSTAISSTGVAANTFVGKSIFGEIELGIGAPKTAGVDSTRPFYVDSKGFLHANDAEVKGDIYCDTLYVDDEDIMDLLRALSRNVEATEDELELSNTELDIKFTRSGNNITHEGGGITFTDMSNGGTRGNAGLLGADIAASGTTGLGLETKSGYPIVMASGGDMAFDATGGIYIGQKATDICIGNNNAGVDLISIGPSESFCSTAISGDNVSGWVYINGRTIKDWLTEASGGGGTAVYA